MSLRWKFNPKALEVFAKELRRASWGICLAAAGGGIHWENAAILLSGAICWFVLQITALGLESVEEDKRRRK